MVLWAGVCPHPTCALLSPGLENTGDLKSKTRRLTKQTESTNSQSVCLETLPVRPAKIDPIAVGNLFVGDWRKFSPPAHPKGGMGNMINDFLPLGVPFPSYGASEFKK
jgi:hypothetical protein